MALSSLPREGTTRSLSEFVELCIDSRWKQRADARQHYLRPQEREIFSEIVLMDLKLESINPVMQENVTNIRKQGRLAWSGVFETGHLLRTPLSSPPLPSPTPTPLLHSRVLGNVLTQDQGELSVKR